MKALISLPPPKPSPIERVAFLAARAAVSRSRLNDSGTRAALDDARALYPNAADVHQLVRAAIDPATTSSEGWAAELIATVYGEWLSSLAPLSAAGKLMQLGGISVPGAADFKAPGRTTSPTGLPWAGESAPLAVREYAVGAVQLSPRKFGVITTLTRELMRNSGAEELLRQMLREDASAALDQGYFSTAAGDETTHAGLLHGVSALPASTAGGKAALKADLTALVRAIQPVTGQVAFIVSPTTASLLSVMFPEFTGNVLPSAAVADSRVVGVDPASLVHMPGDQPPDILASSETALHMEDANPAQIGIAGSPNVVAAPVVSMWQTASIALRVTGMLAFAKRRPTAVQFIDGIDWSDA